MKSLFKISIIAAFVLVMMSFRPFGAQLTVTVINDLGNVEEGATVQLYETEEDYNAEKNAAVEGITDKKGIVKFRDLKPIQYYLLARKDDKDNTGGGEQTGKLEDRRVNKVNVVIQ